MPSVVSPSSVPLPPAPGGAPLMGVVEGTSADGILQIRTSAGPVSCTLPEGATLAAGDRVLLRLTPEGLMVEPVAAESLTRTLPPDSARLLTQLTVSDLPQLLASLKDLLSEKGMAGTGLLLEKIDTLRAFVSTARGQAASMRTELAALLTEAAVTTDTTPAVLLKTGLRQPTAPSVLPENIPVDSGTDTVPVIRIHVVKGGEPEIELPLPLHSSRVNPAGSSSASIPLFASPLRIPLSRALPEITALLHTLESPVLKALPPEIFLSAVQKAREVALPDLLALDRSLSILDSRGTPLKPGSITPSVLANAFTLSAGSVDRAGVAAALLDKGGGIGPEAESLLDALKRHDGGAILGDALARIATASRPLPSATPVQRTEWLDALVRLVGLTLEHDLAAGRSHDAGLKMALLIEHGRLPRAADAHAAPAAPSASDSAAPLDPAEASPVDALRSRIEALVERVEAAQMHSRARELPDGSVTQSFLLPVRMGGEWSDLKVRLLREGKNKQQGRKSGVSSVRIDITLSGTGAIAADLVLRTGSVLELSLGAATKRARIWFEGCAEKIEEALRQLADLPVTVRVGEITPDPLDEVATGPAAVSKNETSFDFIA